MSKHPADLRVLLLLTNTLAAERWSGVHRVAVELARNLSAHVECDIVKWDEQDGQLRFADRRDFDRLFGKGRWPDAPRLRPTAHKVRYRFGDELDAGATYWLINPEIGYHGRHGNEIFARIITQCREYRVRIASIFYDLIPITNAGYRDHASPHIAYLGELFRSDLILPISQWSGRQLTDYYAGVAPESTLPAITSILLPELQKEKAAARPAQAAVVRDTVVMVGTVEPRKQQVAFLRAFSAARRASETVAQLRVFIAGSLHPAVAVEFRQLLADLPDSEYADYASDEQIEEQYGRALFSAFVSNDEGYGLPIAESLARGVPCLCANFGSMAEVAAGGGCMTIDVDDPAALEAAIVRLAEDEALRRQLEGEIEARQFQNWSDYAGEVVDAIAAAPPLAPAPVAAVTVTPAMLANADAAMVDRWSSADVVGLPDERTAEAFVETAARFDAKPLLPTHLVLSAEAGAAEEKIGLERARSLAIASVEKGYARMRAGLPAERQASDCFLRIIISTFNRGPFVAENVRWLLERVATPESKIDLVVVDNASGDDTETRLQAFRGHPRFTLHTNPANVGMLGNLQVCSTLTGAEYIWVIGDDDFIVPEQVGPILAALRTHAGIPLAFANFGVYHRFALATGDSAETLIAEQIALAPNAIESGVIPLSRAGAQHDNLFTAIYPIIWRADVLGACFNYPFTGIPFGDLIESVPTTKLLLESYGSTDVYWHAPIGIVGNAHNSWSRHRPRWHGRLMPQVFELARMAGIDAPLLQRWSAIHVDLFHEAVDIARTADTPINMKPEEYDVAWRVFRQRIERTLPAMTLATEATS